MRQFWRFYIHTDFRYITIDFEFFMLFLAYYEYFHIHFRNMEQHATPHKQVCTYTP
jgi:hypothetical protein